MEKVFLTDGSGKFFNVENAEMYACTENAEELYRTEKGSWVKTNGKVYGPYAEVEELTPQEAAEWFVDNGYEFNEIPEDLQEFCDEEI